MHTTRHAEKHSKDAECVSSWHDPNLCDGECDCPCKSHVNLHQEDLEAAAHTLSSEELVHKETK